jgi:hypothetical protein
MLLPAEWRVITSVGFDAELVALAGGGSRTSAILKRWRFYLTRDPMRFSWGLTQPDDDMRVISTVDPQEGAEYFAGVWIDRRRRAVALTWVQVASQSPGELKRRA